MLIYNYLCDCNYQRFMNRLLVSCTITAFDVRQNEEVIAGKCSNIGQF